MQIMISWTLCRCLLLPPQPRISRSTPNPSHSAVWRRKPKCFVLSTLFAHSGGGRGHDGERSLSTDGRIQNGGEWQGRGVGRGAGRGNRRNRGRVYFEPDETKTCYKCNGQGHLANVCPSESAGEAESARKRTTLAQTKACLRALSQELTEADMSMRLFGDEWDDNARSVRTDGRQFHQIPTASGRAWDWRHHDEPSQAPT